MEFQRWFPDWLFLALARKTEAEARTSVKIFSREPSDGIKYSLPTLKAKPESSAAKQHLGSPQKKIPKQQPAFSQRSKVQAASEGTCRGTYPDAGRAVTASQRLLFSSQKCFLKWGVRVRRSRGEAALPPGHWSPGSCRGGRPFQPLFQPGVPPSEMAPRVCWGPALWQQTLRLLASDRAPTFRSPEVSRAWRETSESLNEPESPAGPPAHRQNPDEPPKCVAKIQPLSAGAEVKCGDGVLGKGEINSFIASLGKGGHSL